MKHININILKGQNCVYLVKTCLLYTSDAADE